MLERWNAIAGGSSEKAKAGSPSSPTAEKDKETEKNGVKADETADGDSEMKDVDGGEKEKESGTAGKADEKRVVEVNVPPTPTKAGEPEAGKDEKNETAVEKTEVAA